jgi:outer membrane beta-barrel protein
MRRFLIGLTALAVCAYPLPLLAAPPEEPPPEDELVLDEEDMDAAPTEPTETGPADTSFLDEGEEGGETGAEVGGTEGTADVNVSLSEEEQRKADERDITVIQPQAFLNVFIDQETGKKKRRIELMPIVGLTINDPYVRHWAAGAEINFWLTNRMALGLNGTAFFGAKTAQYDRIRFQEGLLLTANKTLWQASLDYQYEFLYGKIALFNRLLLHWESYLQIGGGVIHTQNLPRFQAVHPDPFNHITGQVNFAVGVRYYIQNLDWFSVNLGVRTFGFFDAYEPQNRGVNQASGDNPLLNPTQAAYAAAKDQPLGERLAFNVLFFIGASFYLPPKFDYSYRR